MQFVRHALWLVGLGFGVLAELVGRAPLPVLDAVTGFTLIALGLLAWQTRPRFAAGAIMAAAGFAWFLGTIAGWALFWHRAPLAQLMLSYPVIRLWPTGRYERIGVLAAYAYALAYPLAANDEATIVFAGALLVLSGRRWLAGREAQRRALFAALAATTMFALVLILGATVQLDGAGNGRALLIVYELVVVVIAGGLSADLRWGKWTEATVTALVIDLGDPATAGSLRDRLARTLGDPTLTIGYWLTDRNGYVDETGRPLLLPSHGDHRTVRWIDDAGAPLAVLIHDPDMLDDPALVGGITAATRLAVANARLEAEVRARMEDVAASRRRLLEAADEQRHHLELELHNGAERQLAHVAELLAGTDGKLVDATASLDAARNELREFARGIHPAALTDAGLMAALTELAARSPIPVRLTGSADRWPAAVEAAAYFICSEGLANVAKHARATHADIHVTVADDGLHVKVTDDGLGGAGPAAGSGLRGLQDRAETLGGHLRITSPHGGGTELIAVLPLPRRF